jgi:hypothetical protein
VIKDIKKRVSVTRNTQYQNRLFEKLHATPAIGKGPSPGVLLIAGSGAANYLNVPKDKVMSIIDNGLSKALEIFYAAKW